MKISSAKITSKLDLKRSFDIPDLAEAAAELALPEIDDAAEPALADAEEAP